MMNLRNGLYAVSRPCMLQARACMCVCMIELPEQSFKSETNTINAPLSLSESADRQRDPTASSGCSVSSKSINEIQI